jgi:hypothetical protein
MSLIRRGKFCISSVLLTCLIKIAHRCGCEATLADRPQSAYTPAMTLKNAAFLALLGMILVTILLVAGFIGDVLGVARGLIPANRLLTSFIYAVAGLSMVVFLYAFHKTQS